LYYRRIAVLLLASAALGICLSAVTGEDTTGEEPKLKPRGGAFDRLWNKQSRAKYFIRPGVLPEKTPQRPAKTDVRPLDHVSLPADFQKHKTLLIAGGVLSRKCPGVLPSVVAAVSGRLDVVVLVANKDDRRRVEAELTEAKLPADAVRFLKVPVDTMWVRDYGPIFVKDAEGRSLAVDTEYQISRRPSDNAIPPPVAKYFNTRLDTAELLLEGGNLLSNGRGLCLTTTTINRNIARGLDAADVVRLLRKHFGSVQTAFLEPLDGEHSGHVDVFACFTAPDTVVVGSYEKDADPRNAAILDRNAQRLSRLVTPHGKLRVVRIPMGNNEDGRFRTYTNGIFANGIFLLPRYEKSSTVADRRAAATFSRLLPTSKIVRIDCEQLIQHDGALRCISGYVP